ncbi:hypothetical protein C8F01DRAFT_1081505 [Mycena amicta]|nr:hypothetical protein C8F01DRAFT_1081505 [Mycena amicta]
MRGNGGRSWASFETTITIPINHGASKRRHTASQQSEITPSNEPQLVALHPVNGLRWFADTFNPELARSQIEDALAGSISDVIQAIWDNLTSPIRASLNHTHNPLKKVQILFGHLDAQSGHTVLVHSLQEAVLRWGGIDHMLNHRLQSRKDILLQLERLFQPTEQKEQKVMLLHGLGGAGKTQIALIFIAESGSRFTNQFKINASSAEMIEAGYKQIAMAKKLRDTAEAAQTWLKANQVQAGAFISKSPPVRQDISKYIPLYQENKATLLRKKPDQSHDDYAWTVYTTWQISFDQLGPLAAQFLQLCSFIHIEGITEDMFQRASTYTPQNGLLDPTLATLQVALDFLANFRTAESKWNSLAFGEMMSDICDYSLMTWQKDAYSIHPLVHQWSKTMISDLIGQRQLMVTLLGMAAACSMELMERVRLLLHMMLFSEDGDLVGTGFEGPFGDIFQAGGMFRRAETLRSGMLMRSEACLGAEHPDTIEATAKLAATFRNLGQYTDAKKLEEQVLETRTKLLGAEHPDTIIATAHLAETYRNLGQYTDAQVLQKQVLEKQTKLLGAEHPHTLRSAANLAVTLKDQVTANLAATFRELGQYTDAQVLEEQVLEKQTKLFGAAHPETIIAKANLAVTFMNLGRYMDAQMLEEQVLEKQTRLLGAEHHNTIAATANLALPFRKLGQYTDAQMLEEQVLEKRTILLGAEHPDTIWATANLARTYGMLGRYTDAQELQKQPQHHAATFRELGQYTDAQMLEEQELEKRTKLFGTEHPETIWATANLALTFQKLGRYPDAQWLQEQVLEKRTMLLGAKHPDTIEATANLAETYRSLGESTDTQFMVFEGTFYETFKFVNVGHHSGETKVFILSIPMLF